MYCHQTVYLSYTYNDPVVVHYGANFMALQLFIKPGTRQPQAGTRLVS